MPLLLEEDDASPELTLWDDAEYADDSWQGGYKQLIGVGVMMGDDVVYAMRECDLRDLTHAQHGGPDENGKRAGVFIQEGPTRVRRVGSTSVEVCVQNRTGMEGCQVYEDDASVDGDFAVPNLEPGDMFPIVWRSDGKRATDFAFQVGVPQELTETLLRYANALGVTELIREYTSSDPILPGEEMHDPEFLAPGPCGHVQWRRTRTIVSSCVGDRRELSNYFVLKVLKHTTVNTIMPFRNFGCLDAAPRLRRSHASRMAMRRRLRETASRRKVEYSM